MVMLLSLTACFPLLDFDISQYLSYQVDNSYFEPITYTPQTYTDTSNGTPTYNYVFEISSSCVVDLYQYTADVKIYSQSLNLLDRQVINKTQDVAANQSFCFVVPVTSSIQSSTGHVEVTFTGRSHSNPLLSGSKAQVKVTFVYNNGNANSVVTLNSGDRVTQPTNPTKPNHYFVGWYTNPSFTSQYDFATPVTRNITLYAKYQLDSLSLGEHIYNDTLKGVVTIYNKCYNTLLGFETTSVTSQGSGFCFEASNGYYYLLTNCHVAYRDTGYAKQSFTIVDYLGNQYQGYMYSSPSSKVDAIASSYDLACLYFKSTDTPVKALPMAQANPSLGINVVSIGTPQGNSNTVTYGKISDYGTVTLADTSAALSDVRFNVIFHNADIDNGSSGGPLFNTNLEVVGVNYAGAENSTMGYAIPIKRVREFLNKYVYTQNTKANEISLAFFCCNYLLFCGKILAKN